MEQNNAYQEPCLRTALKLITAFLNDHKQENADCSNPECILLGSAPIADTKGQLNVVATANLTNHCATEYIQFRDTGMMVAVDRLQFASIAEMNTKFLSCLTMEGLLELNEDLWSKFFRCSEGRKWIKEMYPRNTRICLEKMDDPFHPVPAGTCGRVICVDDMGQLHIAWDNGSTLALIYGLDRFHVVEEAYVV